MTDAKPDAKRGVLLINLGTPAAPRVREVRSYLREFLMDPHVIDIPGPARWLLVHGVILPTRPRRSAAAYAQVWTPEGSPLAVHHRALVEAMRRELAPAGWAVEGAMRYGEPSIAAALRSLAQAGVTQLQVRPLYPQYSLAATESSLARVRELAPSLLPGASLREHVDFPVHPGFIRAQAEAYRETLGASAPDHTLFSFHGLPERQIRRTDPTGGHCFGGGGGTACCARWSPAPGSPGRACYRAQCEATARALAGELGLAPGAWSVSFQSRLGRTPWIRPFSDQVVPELARAGVRRLAVLCPSFVADCLETLEEVGIRLRASFLEAGGQELTLVPCVNARPSWVRALAQEVRAS